jgi:predicted DCC family thiol-disulfide oxidoreductase YuxK
METMTNAVETKYTSPPGQPIVFFDGCCVMCNRFVDLILRVDRAGVFRFAPLQGETARRLLPPLPENPLEWSMIYLDERGVYDQSDASLEVYRRLGGLWWWLSLFRFIPRPVRNPVYRVIARNRYRWFGRTACCRLPTGSTAERFLP